MPIPDTEIGTDGIDSTDGMRGILGTTHTLLTEVGTMALTTGSILHSVLIMDSIEDLVVSVVVLPAVLTTVLQPMDLDIPTLIIQPLSIMEEVDQLLVLEVQLPTQVGLTPIIPEVLEIQEKL